MKALLQSALDVALSVVRANPTVLEGLGAHLEGSSYCQLNSLPECAMHYIIDELPSCSPIIAAHPFY